MEMLNTKCDSSDTDKTTRSGEVILSTNIRIDRARW